jgi:hypothetical protein
VYMGVLVETSVYEAKRARLRGTMDYGVNVTDFLQLDPTYENGDLMLSPTRYAYNPLPLMNEDPGQSERQNVRMTYDDVVGEPDCVVFVTNRAVKKGEELLTYYGYNYDRSSYACASS